MTLDILIDNQIDNQKQSKDEQYQVEFAQIWADYPRRFGTNSKFGAYRVYKRARDAKVPKEVIHQGVINYRLYCIKIGYIGTEYVMQAQRFFGRDRCWESYQEEQQLNTMENRLLQHIRDERRKSVGATVNSNE